MRVRFGTGEHFHSRIKLYKSLDIKYTNTSEQRIYSSITDIEAYSLKNIYNQPLYPSLDVLLLCDYIVPVLNISIRFVGNEIIFVSRVREKNNNKDLKGIKSLVPELAIKYLQGMKI